MRREALVDSPHTFADVKNIENSARGSGLYAHGPPPITKDLLPSVGRMDRDLTEIQDLQYVCVTHLELDRNAEKVKIPYRILRFQGEKRNVFFS